MINFKLIPPLRKKNIDSDDKINVSGIKAPNNSLIMNNYNHASEIETNAYHHRYNEFINNHLASLASNVITDDSAIEKELVLFKTEKKNLLTKYKFSNPIKKLIYQDFNPQIVSLENRLAELKNNKHFAEHYNLLKNNMIEKKYFSGDCFTGSRVVELDEKKFLGGGHYGQVIARGNIAKKVLFSSLPFTLNGLTNTELSNNYFINNSEALKKFPQTYKRTIIPITIDDGKKSYLSLVPNAHTLNSKLNFKELRVVLMDARKRQQCGFFNIDAKSDNYILDAKTNEFYRIDLDMDFKVYQKLQNNQSTRLGNYNEILGGSYYFNQKSGITTEFDTKVKNNLINFAKLHSKMKLISNEALMRAQAWVGIIFNMAIEHSQLDIIFSLDKKNIHNMIKRNLPAQAEIVFNCHREKLIEFLTEWTVAGNYKIIARFVENHDVKMDV